MLSEELTLHYKKFSKDIKKRLNDFKKVPESQYYWELCYCLLTPQSSAKNAELAVMKIKEACFREKRFNPSEILRDKENYIRFHNVKAQRLLMIDTYFPSLIAQLQSKRSATDKRLWLLKNINGLGMKECSHFLRNIGYEGLAILDRHILKNLVKLGVYESVPNVGTIKGYLEAEEKFFGFSDKCGIKVDELDLLFWSYETGEILK